MHTGKVKWFNHDKGYGFIAPDQGGKDVFVHITAVQRAGIREIDEGLALQYDLEDRHGKKCACDLKVVES